MTKHTVFMQKVEACKAYMEYALNNQTPQLLKLTGHDAAIMRSHVMGYGYPRTFDSAWGNWIGKDLTLNLINTPFTFYLPSIFGVGFQSGLFIMIYIQFLKGIPKELEEAAWMDGAGPIKTFATIIIPSSGVAILTVSILSVIWHWNEYYLMGLYFNENRPLAVVLSDIMNLISLKGGDTINSHTGVAMASCMLFILPVLIFYLILQKKFIKSIDSVGIVG